MRRDLPHRSVAALAPVWGRPPGRLALPLCFLAVFYLAASLSVSASFLLAKGTIGSYYESLLADHSELRFSAGSGEGEEGPLSHGPERLRGALHSKVSTEEVLACFVGPEGSTLRRENFHPDPGPDPADPEPKSASVSQELLGRPPPA